MFLHVVERAHRACQNRGNSSSGATLLICDSDCASPGIAHGTEARHHLMQYANQAIPWADTPGTLVGVMLLTIRSKIFGQLCCYKWLNVRYFCTFSHL